MPKSATEKYLAGSQVRFSGKIELKSPSSLRSNARNARTHPKKQIKQLANSMVRFGFTVPVLIDSNNMIIAGHGRVEAAKLLGLKQIPLIQIDHLTETEKRALVLADNKLAQNAGWSRELLADELADLAGILPEEGMELELTGFQTAEFDAIVADFGSPPPGAADALPSKPETPVSIPGDLWKAGDHRIVCGDARRTEVFARLMDGDAALMVFTDPPYNVQVSGHVGGRGKIKHREFAVGSGELSSSQFKAFLQQVLALCAEHSMDGSIHYVCMDWRHTEELQAAAREIYSALKNICVWVKTNAGQGSFYRSQHEFVFVFKKGDAEHLNTFELGQHGRTRTNVWNYPGVNSFRSGRMDELQMHPTVKPTALVVDAMKDCSKRGSIVLDCFLGSGTTLVAAEQVGRRAYGIELDPAYVDVAIDRWQKLTGRDAVLDGTSLTFDEIRADPSLRLTGQLSKSRRRRRGSR